MCQITSIKILHMNDYLLTLWLSKPTQREQVYFLFGFKVKTGSLHAKKSVRVFTSTNQGRLLETYFSYKLFMDTNIFIEWEMRDKHHFPLSPVHFASKYHTHEKIRLVYVYLLTLFLFFCSSKRLFRLEISSSFLSTFPCNSAITSSFTFNLQNHPTENQIETSSCYCIDEYRTWLFPATARKVQEIKMISTKHLSNNGKYQVTKRTSWHGNILNKGKKILSRFKLSS